MAKHGTDQQVHRPIATANRSIGARARPFAIVCYEVIMRALFALPRYGALNAVKTLFLRMNGATVGRRVVFYPGVWIIPGRGLSLGDDVDLALDVLITTGGGVTIGDRVLIGYRTCIISGNHVIPPIPGRIFDAGHVGRPVTIENDVWVGCNCTILGGVTIGEGAVIGAGSVVTKDVPSFAIAAGVPAKVIRQRASQEEALPSAAR